MTNPAVIILTGLVVAAAAVIAVFASNSAQPQSYERRGRQSSFKSRSPSPPSSPIPGSYQGKRRTRNKRRDCSHCGESASVTLLPCNHASLCKGCASNYLENHDTCPECECKIGSCSPTIPSFGKCEGCQEFTKIIKLKPCNHSLSLCINCFVKKEGSYKECPECKSQIRGFEPNSNIIGICKLCYEFGRLVKFQPCAHSNFCRKHAEKYLKSSDDECHDCGRRVDYIE